MGIPVTEHVRPVVLLMEQARELIEAAGVKARIYTGTGRRGLEDDIATAVSEGMGQPVAVICYGGSEFANSPRRVLVLSIVVVSAHTRVAPGVPDALEAARAVTAMLDEHQTTATEADGWTVRDVWRVVAEDVLDLSDIDAAAAVQLTVTIEDR